MKKYKYWYVYIRMPAYNIWCKYVCIIGRLHYIDQLCNMSGNPSCNAESCPKYIQDNLVSHLDDKAERVQTKTVYAKLFNLSLAKFIYSLT